MRNINDKWYTVSENNKDTNTQYSVDETDNHDDICISIPTSFEAHEDIEEEVDRPSNYIFTCPECGGHDLWCTTRDATVYERVIMRDTEVKDTDITDDCDGYITLGYGGGQPERYYCSLCDWEVPIDEYTGDSFEEKLIEYLKEHKDVK